MWDDPFNTATQNLKLERDYEIKTYGTLVSCTKTPKQKKIGTGATSLHLHFVVVSPDLCATDATSVVATGPLNPVWVETNVVKRFWRITTVVSYAVQLVWACSLKTSAPRCSLPWMYGVKPCGGG